LRRALTETPFASAWDEAQHWHVDEAIRYALSAQAECVAA
jgi:hypothetical protein